MEHTAESRKQSVIGLSDSSYGNTQKILKMGVYERHGVPMDVS